MADGKVTVDDKKIVTLGGDIVGLGKNLDSHITTLDGLTINPGDFEDGNAFKDIVEERAKSFSENLTQVKTVLGNIEEGLSNAAALYVKEDDDNNVKAQNWYQGVEKTLPGFDEFEPKTPEDE
jgi:hypothetical protein